MCPSSGETTIYATVGTCYSVWMTVWYVGCTNTVVSPVDGHIFVQKHIEKRNKHTKKNYALW